MCSKRETISEFWKKAFKEKQEQSAVQKGGIVFLCFVVPFMSGVKTKYKEHKEKRFPKADFEIPIRENEAFLLSDPATREAFERRYRSTAALYYRGQPAFEDVVN